MERDYLPEYNTIPAAHTKEDHIDRYVDMLSRLLIEDFEISRESPHECLPLQQLIRASIFRCYIFISESGHPHLANAFVESRRREDQSILTK